MSVLPEYAVPHLNTIAENEGITNFTIELKPGSKHGDNFIGEMISVALIGKRDVDGKQVDARLDLLCKIAPSNATRRREFKSDLVFEREAFAYNKLLPQLVEFQKERGLSEAESFVSFPKCYYATCKPETEEYLVIMDDLRTKGYEMWPKQQSIPIVHCRLVIQELAKFHAVSYALKDQKPEIFDEFKKLSDILREFYRSEKINEYIAMTFNRAIAVLKNDEHIAMMEDVKTQYTQYMKEILDEDINEEIGVITHGDCWNNNVIYHYKNGEKIPDKICLVDWQLIRYSSPALDLHYNLFTSTDKDLRDKEYDNIIQLYHSTLTDSIEKLGSDPKKLISYEEFRRQLKRFGNFVILMAPMIVQIVLANPQDILNLDELSEQMANGGEVQDIVKEYDEDTQKAYADRINGIVTDFINFGYYQKS